MINLRDLEGNYCIPKRLENYLLTNYFNKLLTKARTGNLAQASRTRLRESDGGSPRPSARVVAQVSGPNFLSERLPRSGKVSSPKRAGAFVSVRVIELSSRRRGTRLSESPSRLSETPWPERRA
ncbi:hypothetical protein DEO72_LG11g1336 [Vigna unguiculata]|uniref:Uncharacterized protein n=1 Tax=Vigna unguiculata TaxID=3917 RepID=A0A4D6NRB8_VIGUN|nr:hypothetical protein DEO72_LG11g1336 [Vigna unguiculata]